jgi:hypothetical protein
MPASTAEKRARQRANKLKSSASTAQTPEIVSLPIQSTDSTPIQTSTPPPFDFNFFIRNAGIINIHDFFAAVSTTTEGQNLKLLWKRAYEEGRNHGLDEGMLKCSEEYARGHKAGCEMATTYFDVGREQGMAEGEEHGREVECQVWLSSGHGVGQCTPTSEPRSFTSTALQTDDPVIVPADLSDGNLNTQPTRLHTSVSTQTSTISYLNTSIQATEPPPSLSQPQKTSAALLDWAEDTISLPITPIPPSLGQPRDLSVLRSSSSSSPFSSLQRRSKKHTTRARQSYRRHSHFNFNSPHWHYNSYKPSQPHFHIKTHSHLNWESDPRLSDLSRSLKALGWIRAS